MDLKPLEIGKGVGYGSPHDVVYDLGLSVVVTSDFLVKRH